MPSAQTLNTKQSDFTCFVIWDLCTCYSSGGNNKNNFKYKMQLVLDRNSITSF